MATTDEQPNVRFASPVKNKDQSRVQSRPYPNIQTFNVNAPVMDGAYRTLDDKAFK